LKWWVVYEVQDGYIDSSRRYGILTAADVQVKVCSKAEFVSIPVLEPTVEELVKVVEIVLAKTAICPPSSGSIVIGHAFVPAVVSPDSQDQITTIFFQTVGEVSGTSLDVVGNVSAITAWGLGALIASQLHQTLFTSSTNGLRVAATLLHGKGCQHDGRDVVLVAILVESPNEVLAGLEGAFGILKGRRKLCGDNLIDGNVLRVPTTIVQITVQPTHRAVRAGVLGDGLGSANVTAVGFDG